jgi:hypothetical protein
LRLTFSQTAVASRRYGKLHFAAASNGASSNHSAKPELHLIIQ